MYIDPQTQELLNLSQDEFNILLYIFVPLEALSIILSGFVCITFIVFKNKFPARLVMCMALSIFFNHIVDIWLLFTGPRLFYDETLCTVQGALEQFASIGSVIWWFCITVNVCLSFVLRRTMHKFEKIFHFSYWVICAVTVCLSIERIGAPQGLLCWVTEGEWQFMLYYGPVGFFLVIGGGFHIATVYKITKVNSWLKKTTRSSNTSEIIPMYIFRQTIFISWFFLIYFFFFTHRIYIYVQHVNQNVDEAFFLTVCAIIAQSSQGIFVFIIFGMKKAHWRLWKAKITLGISRSKYDQISSEGSQKQISPKTTHV